MKRVLLFFAFAVQALWPVTSETENQGLTPTDTLALRLQESVLIALENNPTVTIQRLNPEIAETYSREERADFDPDLSLSASRSETKQQRFLGSRPDPFEMTTERLQYDLSVTEKLPTGTEITAEASISGSISSIYTDQYTGTIGLSVTQSLLRGFGIGNNLANLRRAKIDVDISLLELEAVAEQVVADVERAYWDLFLAEDEMHIQHRSLELAEKQLSESRERVAVGRLPELELAAVHAEVATRREAMIDAQSRYEQARLHFLFLLNLPQERNWDIIPLPLDRPFVPVDTLDTIQNHEHLGLKYRADLQQAQLNLRRNELDIAQTRNGLLPRLDVFITLGRTTYAQSFGESLPDVKSPFYDISAGVNFEFPLPNRQARAHHARAQYTQDQLELALSNMEQLVRWDVRSAYIEVLRSRQQIEATLVARDLQEKKLLAEQEKFRVGKSTNFLVLQAQRDFVASQLDEARAKVAYLDALVDLYVQEGTLLERRGIESFVSGQ
ncbi:MAG: TolC family protein [Gemmatimonadota bacterium]|nr:MAG: TolC family protein [Gemmatimonadota bacterium]